MTRSAYAPQPAWISRKPLLRLRFADRKRVHHADDAMARITAKQLIQHLELSDFVLMKKPDKAAPSTSKHGHPNYVD